MSPRTLTSYRHQHQLTHSTTVSNSSLILGELKKMRGNLDSFEKQVRAGDLDIKVEEVSD